MLTGRMRLEARRQIALSRARSLSLAAPRLMGLLRVRAEHLLPIALVMMP